MPLAVSMALPPPTLTMQSAPRSRANAAPASTMWTPGVGHDVGEDPGAGVAEGLLDPRRDVGAAREDGSVTISARVQPRARTSSLTSRDEPEPKTTRVVFMKMNERLES